MKLVKFLFVLGIGLLVLSAFQTLRGQKTGPYVVLEKDTKKYDSIVRLVKDGQTYCSGVVVSPTIIITAGHCVIEDNPLASIFGGGTGIQKDPIEIRPIDNSAIGVTGVAFYGTSQMDQGSIHGNFSMFDVRPYISDPALLAYIEKTSKSFISCGYPLGGSLYCTKQLNEGNTYAFMWTLKGILLPGMSGGPTMLPDGTVVAINDAVLEDGEAVVTPIFNLDKSY